MSEDLILSDQEADAVFSDSEADAPRPNSNLCPKFFENIHLRCRSKKVIPSKNRRSRNSHRRSDLLNLQTYKFSEKILTAPSSDHSISSFSKTSVINGNKIVGNWTPQGLHGHVTIDYETGEHFEGLYQYGKKVEGRLMFNDKTVYVGKFKDEMFHGIGRITDPTGRRVTCEWTKGVPGRKGKIEYPSGDSYCGELFGLKKHGEGYLFFANGHKFMGNFVDGKIQGYGRYYSGDTKIAEGYWFDGVLEGDDMVNVVLRMTYEKAIEDWKMACDISSIVFGLLGSKEDCLGKN